MTLLEVCSEFSSDARCRELLARLRWPGGAECLRCGTSDIARLSPKLWYCRKCDYQFSVTVGTIFADSHLPLLTWFAAAYLICESRKGMSANQIKRMLGVSYKTAWFLCHRIRASMIEAGREALDGIVEVDLLAYLHEMTFRFNRRDSPDLFIEVLSFMVSTSPLRFATLIK